MTDGAIKWSAALTAALALLVISKPISAHFAPGEFGLWYPLVSGDTLSKLFLLRERWGRPIHVSPVDGALGRIDDSESQHNILHTVGVVKALDVFPEGSNGPVTREESDRFGKLARAVGFTGIGLYSDTFFRGRAWRMVHLDTRPGVAVATWSRVNGVYSSGWDQALTA